MNSLDTGKDKIKKICEILQNETLQPAKQEANTIIEQARNKAASIIADAHTKAQQIEQEAKVKVEKRQELFNQSLQTGFAGAKEKLRQEIEATLLKETFIPWVKEQTSHPDVAAKLITAIVEALQKEGTSANLSAVISDQIKPAEVNALLGEKIVALLKEKEVVVGSFHGGVKIKLHDEHLTLDLSDESIVELLVSYIAKEFRDVIFGA